MVVFHVLIVASASLQETEYGREVTPEISPIPRRVGRYGSVLSNERSAFSDSRKPSIAWMKTATTITSRRVIREASSRTIGTDGVWSSTLVSAKALRRAFCVVLSARDVDATVG